MLFLYISLLTFFSKKKKNIPFYLLGFILSFIPFLIFDIRHQNLLSKNILSYMSSLFQFQGSGLSINSLLSIFAKIFDYLLFPLSSVNYWFKVIFAFLAYLYVIIFNLRKKKEINLFFAMAFIIFFFSFFIFKRNFDYYMACFMIWFYFGLGLVIYDLTKRVGIGGKTLVTGILLLFISLNTYKYFTLPVNAFGLAKQNKIIEIIKRDLSKVNIKELSIYVFPHNDDVNSLEYIMTLDHFFVNNDSNNKYYICYVSCTRIKEDNKKLYLDDDISIYKNY
jgi:hypothetical protein